MKRLFLAVSIAMTLFSPFQSYSQEVIVHRDVTQQEIPRNTLRAIFGMRLRKWPDGKAIRVFVFRDDAPLHVEFSKSVLHMFPYQLRRAWDRQVYSGTGQSPIEVESLEEMQRRVANTPGAIGYLSLNRSMNSPLDKAMKVIHVR